MSKVIVIGCSVSDYTQVDKCYGEEVAEKINKEYIHLAAGCSSNERIFRIISNWIVKEKINRNDTLIIQYTNIIRREFYSRFVRPDVTGHLCSTDKAASIRERYHSGDLIKYKLNAQEWQPEAEEKQFFNLYENNFLSYELDLERFIGSHYQLVALLTQYGIKTVFNIINGYVIEGMDDVNKDLFYESFANNEKISYINTSSVFEVEKFCLEKPPITASHLSSEGHTEVARRILKVLCDDY